MSAEKQGQALPHGKPLLPAWSDVPGVAVRIARAVGGQAVADGVAPPKRSEEELSERITQIRWIPEYLAAPA
jgi:malate dehydrogenase (oxaloacetate-decarboxylating)